MRAVVDAETPLLSRDSPSRSRGGHILSNAALAAFGLVGVGVAATRAAAPPSSTLGGVDTSVGHLGYYRNTSRLPHGEPGSQTPPLTYTLHLGCHDASTDAAFFAEGIVEARVVRHNYGDDAHFFEWDEGIPMKRVNLFPGDTSTFEAVTTDVNWEYGFALKNAAGVVKYEIGTQADGAPLALKETCANKFGEHWNRIIGWDSRMTSEPGYIDFVFGQCRRNCIPVGDPHSWDAEERAKNTQMMLANPPKWLGSAFKMYGSADKGWCTINIHTQRGDSDDILMVFNPRPRQNWCIMDVATGCLPAVNDPNGQCSWAGALNTVPWNDAEMGRATGGDDTKWTFEFTYLEDGMGITLNGQPYYDYKWRSLDGGYDSVSYIQMNGGQPGLVYRTGECDLVASAHPRPRIEHPENLIVGVLVEDD